ncbi:lipopolysaccharide biosynthesis protein [Actinomycetospora sp. CA-053990]|uniref:lipopolysaccharide biosynthesis protein n=1 Tax=Actinomycetospora sp. CA-053990 TaxID=3239891 RepID=UPI003D8DAC3D
MGQATLVVAILAYTAVISRLLDPATFGVYALATLVVWFMDYFARMGLASAIVQKPELTDTDVRAASTAGIVLGLGCCALTWVVAPLFAAAFHMPALTHVMRVLGVGFVFEGWSMTGMGLFIRQLRFRELSIITTGTYMLGYLVVGVSLAAAGAGVWSLVAGVLVSNASQAVWQYAKLRHPIRPVVTWGPYAGVCGYGARLSGTHLIDYLCSNLDTLVVARVFPSAVLGQYNRGYSLAFNPIGYHVAQASTNVVFSSLSRIQEDLGRLRRVYLSGLTVVAVILFPVCAGMSVAATELVRTVLGSQWGLAVGLVPWFAFGAGFAVLSKLSRAVAEARAELNRSLAAQGVQLAVLGTLLLLSAGAGQLWLFAASVAIGEFARLLAYLALMRRILALRLPDVARALMPAVLGSVAVALFVAGIRQAFLAWAPTVVVFAAEVVAGAVALALCLRLGPMREARAELARRLDDAGMLGRQGGLRRRLATAMVGPVASAVSQARES